MLEMPFKWDDLRSTTPYPVLTHPDWFCVSVEDHLLQIRCRGAAVFTRALIAGLHFQSGSEEPAERPGFGKR